ncbi:MAG TPA: site-2 protease family protein [Candidatus Limnocylindrales bacterium]|nr:site-2 protease family protein [Candidatus Limnocylindrales bacterium]
MTPPETEQRAPALLEPDPWRDLAAYAPSYAATPPHPPTRSLILAVFLFSLTLVTCLLAGTHFAAAYAHNQAGSLDTLMQTFTLAYRHPAALLTGLPFAITLLTILLAHELGHYFACRYHHIRSSYPMFIPAPTLIGTFGAFILIRSSIRSARALFDVGASGPLVGFVLAIPAMAYGVLHAKLVPSLASNGDGDLVFGVPGLMHLISAVIQPNAHAGDLILHPVGRAAWVGLFATALNLLPVGQLDGGHILRSVSPRLHRIVSLILPVILVPMGFFLWRGWLIWAALLFGVRYFRAAPIYDPTPLDPNRRFGALLALLVFLLCFMANPL